MLATIPTVESLARARQRDLLLLSFHDRQLEVRWASGPLHPPGNFYQQWMADRLEAWKTHPERQHLTAWLAHQGIGWQPCAPFLSGWMAAGAYWGDICLDLPWAAQDPGYQALRAYLYLPDGGSRFANVTLYAMPLANALLHA